MTVGWPLIIDGIILVLLAATVFVAARLSIQLKDFRESRGALEGLIKQLALNIDKAHTAIQNLQESVRRSGDDLRGRMRDAQELADELEIIIKSGNNLASRMEQLTDTSRNNRPAETGESKRSSRTGVPGIGSFAIRDPDFESELAAEMAEDGTFSGEDDLEDSVTAGFGSRAERELYEALRQSKKEKA